MHSRFSVSAEGVDGCLIIYNIYLTPQKTLSSPPLKTNQTHPFTFTLLSDLGGIWFTCWIKTFQQPPEITTSPAANICWVSDLQPLLHCTQCRVTGNQEETHVYDVTEVSQQSRHPDFKHYRMCHLLSANPLWNYLKWFVVHWCNEEWMCS